MAVYQDRVTVTTTAGPVASTGEVLIRNRGAVAVYLGGPGVTASTGYQVDPAEAVSVDLRDADDILYGITASSTAACHLMAVGA